MFSYKINDTTELRLMQLHHAEELYHLTVANRKHLREWLPWVEDVRSTEDTKAFIRSALRHYVDNGSWNCGIWYHGQLAGVVSFHPIDWTNRSTSLGYWLGQSFEGKGLMTRAVRVAVNHAFRDLKLNRVEIRCAAGNDRSCAIPERLGFKKEGVLEQSQWLYTKYVDLIIYGMVKDRWT